MTSPVKYAIRRTGYDLRDLGQSVVVSTRAWIGWLTWPHVRQTVANYRSDLADIWCILREVGVSCLPATVVVVTVIGSILILEIACTLCDNLLIGALVTAPIIGLYMVTVLLFGSNYLKCMEEQTT
jgi:hypothetical protein